MQTTTQLLQAAIADELEKHKGELNLSDSLDSVSVIVQMDRNSGRPFRVLFRTEHRRDVRIPGTYRAAS